MRPYAIILLRTDEAKIFSLQMSQRVSVLSSPFQRGGRFLVGLCFMLRFYLKEVSRAQNLKNLKSFILFYSGREEEVVGLERRSLFIPYLFVLVLGGVGYF